MYVIIYCKSVLRGVGAAAARGCTAYNNLRMLYTCKTAQQRQRICDDDDDDDICAELLWLLLLLQRSAPDEIINTSRVPRERERGTFFFELYERQKLRASVILIVSLFLSRILILICAANNMDRKNIIYTPSSARCILHCVYILHAANCQISTI